LAEIVDKGLAKLQMTIEASARTALTSLSRGLPHYTHALALHAAVVAIEADQPLISRVHVTTAIKRALEDAHQSTKSAYTKAVSSSHRESLYAQVLLACSLAHCDPMGYFAPADVRDPMTKIMGEPYDIENFNQHLAAFCEDARGSVLHRIGGERRYRYRFSNPLMQPYVMLRGIQVGMLKAEDWGL
jgi:hypothetical protein